MSRKPNAARQTSVEDERAMYDVQSVRTTWSSPASARQTPFRASGLGPPAADLAAAEERALQRAAATSWSEKARYLQQLFGQRAAAAMTGVGDAKTVGRWIRGDQDPQAKQQMRLMAAFQIAMLIEIATSRDTAQAWFLGMNPGLGDALPAEVIASDGEDGGRRVMKAARTFLATHE